MTTRSKLVIANWKSHKNSSEAHQWCQDYSKAVSVLKDAAIEVAIAPAFPLLEVVSHSLTSALLPTSLAIQDLSPFPAGAYTGAVSTHNISSFDIHYALLGHSERRRYFHETHQEIANKVDQALQMNITPLVCIDEQYLAAQAAALSKEQLNHCWVLYEPLEAIGSGLEAPVSEVSTVYEKIAEAFGEVPVLYGGSVKNSNVRDYLNISQGVVVGTASLAVTDFVSLLTAASNASTSP